MWQAIGSIVKIGMGVAQTIEGTAGLAGLQRPKYEIPKEIGEMTGLSRMEYADPTMPGEQAERDRIAQSAATASYQASAAGNPFAAIAAIQGNQQAASQDLTTKSAMYNRQDLESYKRALQVSAGYKDTKFQMNEFAPYAEKAQEYRDMIGAGSKNMYGSITELGGIADAYMGADVKGSSAKTTNTGSVYNKYNKPQKKSSNPQGGGYAKATWNEELGEYVY